MKRTTLFFFIMMFTGCAAERHAAAPQSVVPSDEDRGPSLEEAERQLAHAREEIEAASVATDHSKGEPPAAPSPPPPPAQSEAQGPTTPTDTRRGDVKSEKSTGDGAPAGACATSCRALDSMRRAVSTICRMVGPADNHCVEAKKVLEQNESRVAPCGC